MVAVALSLSRNCPIVGYRHPQPNARCHSPVCAFSPFLYRKRVRRVGLSRLGGGCVRAAHKKQKQNAAEGPQGKKGRPSAWLEERRRDRPTTDVALEGKGGHERDDTRAEREGRTAASGAQEGGASPGRWTARVVRRAARRARCGKRGAKEQREREGNGRERERAMWWWLVFIVLRVPRVRSTSVSFRCVPFR